MTKYTLSYDTAPISGATTLILTRQADGKEAEVFLGRWEPLTAVLGPITTKEVDENTLNFPLLPCALTKSFVNTQVEVCE